MAAAPGAGPGAGGASGGGHPCDGGPSGKGLAPGFIRDAVLGVRLRRAGGKGDGRGCYCYSEGKPVSELQVGDDACGRVTNVEAVGCWVDIGAMRDGLLRWEDAPEGSSLWEAGDRLDGVRVRALQGELVLLELHDEDVSSEIRSGWRRLLPGQEPDEHLPVGLTVAAGISEANRQATPPLSAPTRAGRGAGRAKGGAAAGARAKGSRRGSGAATPGSAGGKGLWRGEGPAYEGFAHGSCRAGPQARARSAPPVRLARALRASWDVAVGEVVRGMVVGFSVAGVLVDFGCEVGGLIPRTLVDIQCKKGETIPKLGVLGREDALFRSQKM